MNTLNNSQLNNFNHIKYLQNQFNQTQRRQATEFLENTPHIAQTAKTHEIFNLAQKIMKNTSSHT